MYITSLHPPLLGVITTYAYAHTYVNYEPNKTLLLYYFIQFYAYLKGWEKKGD